MGMDTWDGTIDNEECPDCWDFDFYERAEDLVLHRLTKFNEIVGPIFFILILGSVQLRRVPLYSQALVLSLLPLVEVLKQCGNHAYYMDAERLLSFFLEKCAIEYGWSLPSYGACIWIAVPVMSTYARKQQRAREVSRGWIVLMLIGLAYWVLVYLRVYNGRRTLYTLIETDHGLEGVAAAVTYLTSSMLDLDAFFATLLPMALGIINSSFARSGGKPHPRPNP